MRSTATAKKCFTAGSPNRCAVRAVCCANVGAVKSSPQSEWIEGSKKLLRAVFTSHLNFVDIYLFYFFIFFLLGGGSGRPKNTWSYCAM